MQIRLRKKQKMELFEVIREIEFESILNSIIGNDDFKLIAVDEYIDLEVRRQNGRHKPATNQTFHLGNRSFS